MMNLNLEGKVAFVGGSTQGIGLAIAQGLAEMGATIVLLARNEARLKTALESLSQAHAQKHDYICVDYDQPNVLKEKIDTFLKATPAAHILINNSGGPAGGQAIDAAVDEYHLAFNRHLVCNQILAQALTPYMKNAGYGRIVNIISTSVKQPLKNLGVSNTIRGAVASWAKTLASELGAFNITVNNVLPGATNTVRLQSIIENKAAKTGSSVEDVSQGMANAVPMKRFASAEEVANAACFLCAPAASYINGINVPVDGGRTLCL